MEASTGAVASAGGLIFDARRTIPASPTTDRLSGGLGQPCPTPHLVESLRRGTQG
jgi:hypothetical protein